MTTYPHELTECEDCGAHYCMGCAGEECPNCKLVGVAFYGIKLEQKLEAVRTFLKEDLDKCNREDNPYVNNSPQNILRGVRYEIMKILEAE